MAELPRAEHSPITEGCAGGIGYLISFNPQIIQFIPSLSQIKKEILGNLPTVTVNDDSNPSPSTSKSFMLFLILTSFNHYVTLKEKMVI